MNKKRDFCLIAWIIGHRLMIWDGMEWFSSGAASYPALPLNSKPSHPPSPSSAPSPTTHPDPYYLTSLPARPWTYFMG